MLEYQCRPGLDEEAKQLRAKVADIDNANTLARVTLANGREKKGNSVEGKRVIAREVKLKEIQDEQKKNIETAKESGKRAADAATQLAKYLLHIMEIEENAKMTTDTLTDMKRLVTGSAKSADGALRRLAEKTKQVELLAKKAKVLKSQLSKMGIVRDSKVAILDGWLREVRAL